MFFDALYGRADRSDSHIEHICLLTERMQVKLLTRVSTNDHARFDVLDRSEKDLLGDSASIPDLNLANIVDTLRQHDSQLVWDEVAKFGKAYISEWICWGVEDNGETRYIFGYLQLELMQRSSVMKQLSRIGLERLVGLRAVNSSVLLEPADALVTDLCENFNSIGDRYNHGSAYRILLGSVCVTGKTVDSMQSEGRLEALHLFRHPNVIPAQRDTNTKTVFCWKNEPDAVTGSPSDCDVRFERIGTSHSISRSGRNHYMIPKKKQDGTYYSYRNPKETYEDIQKVRAGTVRVGHWVYRDNHDFFGLNMRLFVRDAFDRLNDLAWFLIDALFVEAGIPMDGFRPTITDCMNQRIDLMKRNPSGKALVVYPSHPVTDKIIDRLLETLTAQARKKAEQYFLPIRRHRTSHKNMASLISPQSETEVRDALNRNAISRVIMFDDGMVSGNTMRDLMNFLSQLTNLPIEKVVIVNRLREPGSGVESSTTSQFWRLDLPRLGNNESCLLCRAIEAVRVFRDAEVTSERGRERLQEWLVAWRGVDPNREWSGTGLRPLALREAKRLRIGVMDQGNATEGDYVQVEWSTALAVYDVELTALTGLDDHIERLLAKDAPLDPAIETEILTAHLMLFCNDMPPQLRTRLSLRLLGCICQAETPDLRSSLACLVLCAEGVRQGPGFEEKVIKVVLQSKLDLGNVCFDATLLFAYLVAKGVLRDRRFYRSIRLLNTPRNATWRAYNDLYYESRGPIGNPHLLPLQELADGLVTSEKYPKVKCGALDQIDKLNNLLRQLDVRLARPPMSVENEASKRNILPGKAGFDNIRTHGIDAAIEASDENRFDKKLTFLLDKLDELRKNIKKDSGGEWFNKQSTSLMQDKGLRLCAQVMLLLEEFRRQFFFLEFAKDELRRGEFEKYFIDSIYDVINWDAAERAKNTEGVSFIKPELKMSQFVHESIPSDMQISIVSDSSIVRTFSDLLLNTGYGRIQNGQSQPVAKVHTDFFNDKVVISISNRCKEPANNIITKTGRKIHRWFPLNEIGGEVTFKALSSNVIEAKLTIPYAGYCKGVS